MNSNVHVWVIVNTELIIPNLSVFPDVCHIIVCCFSAVGTMITTMTWNDNTNMLAAFQDGKFTVWYYPSAVYVDQDILPQTLLEKDSRSVLLVYR